jgi:hypothetical protein
MAWISWVDFQRHNVSAAGELERRIGSNRRGKRSTCITRRNESSEESSVATIRHTERNKEKDERSPALPINLPSRFCVFCGPVELDLE